MSKKQNQNLPFFSRIRLSRLVVICAMLFILSSCTAVKDENIFMPSLEGVPNLKINSHKEFQKIEPDEIISGICSPEAGPVIITGDIESVQVECQSGGFFSQKVKFIKMGDDQEVKVTQNSPYGFSAQDTKSLIIKNPLSFKTQTLIEPKNLITGTCRYGDGVLEFQGALLNPIDTVCKKDGTFEKFVTFTGTDDNNQFIKVVQNNERGGSSSEKTFKIKPLNVFSSLKQNQEVAFIETLTASCRPGDGDVLLEGSISEGGSYFKCKLDGTFTTEITFLNEDPDQLVSIKQDTIRGVKKILNLDLKFNNPFSSFTGKRPTLAIRAAECAMCHAQVKGDFYTDFGLGDPYYLGQSQEEDFSDQHYSRPYSGPIVPHEGSLKYKPRNWYRAYIRGDIYVPKTEVTLQKLLDAYNDSNTGNAFKEVLSLVDVVIGNFFHEVTEAVNQMIFPTEVNCGDKKCGVTGSVKEIKSMYIGAPTASDILAVKNNSWKTEIDAQNAKLYSAPKVLYSGLKVVGTPPNQYITNEKDFECVGDFIIDGVLYLEDVNVISRAVGCRLYVTKSVFIKGGVSYSGKYKDKANLQISSARSIWMGLNPLYSYQRGTVHEMLIRNFNNGAATEGFYSSIREDAKVIPKLDNDAGPPIRVAHLTYSSPGVVESNENIGYVTRQVKNGLMTAESLDSDPYYKELPDAEYPREILSDCVWDDKKAIELNKPCYADWANSLMRESVDYNKMVLNAPVIHNRYYGKYDGIIVAEFFLPAVGTLGFDYDPIFDTAPILPLINEKVFKKTE